ncbi:MAG: hypothetical protein HGA96_02300 [Desulfobulbaceae bacterium]|nr:hypothetical protein [Desulfobulbaceae bacterium]
MSGLEVIILADGFVLSHARGRVREELRGEDLDIGQELTAFRERHGIGRRGVNLFVAEDLVYGLSLELPLRTPDLKEAISLQLGLLLPFPEEEALNAYSITRQAGSYQVTVFAVRTSVAATVVEELVEDGYTVKGIYPENQRYVTGRIKRQKWALVMRGRQTKVLIFDGNVLQNRLLLGGDNFTHEKLSELCGTALILHTDPPAGSAFISAQPLLAESPLLREYNLLPESYRRPDYLKMVVVLMLLLNLLALGGAIWLRFDNLQAQIKKTEGEIAALLPPIAEVDKTKAKIKKVEAFVATITNIGKNPDLIAIMSALTGDLPEDAYLDQLKYDSKDRLVTINGYANDLTALTGKLQNLGEVRLKSTSRRKDRVYFQVEIVLHE